MGHGPGGGGVIVKTPHPIKISAKSPSTIKKNLQNQCNFFCAQTTITFSSQNQRKLGMLEQG